MSCTVSNGEHCSYALSYTFFSFDGYGSQNASLFQTFRRSRVLDFPVRLRSAEARQSTPTLTLLTHTLILILANSATSDHC